MSELSFYPDGGLQERAEIHGEDAAGEVLAARVAGKVDGAVAPTPQVAPHPRLTSGRHLDELEAVEDSVDGYLRELAGLAGRRQEIEAEVQRMRGIYRQLISAAAIVGAFVLLILIIVILVLTHR